MSRRADALLRGLLIGIIVVSLLIVLAMATGSQMVLSEPLRKVEHPSQSVVRPWAMRDTGALVVQWRLGLVPSQPQRPVPLFNHFCRHDFGGNIAFSTHYYSYTGADPALRLALGYKLALKTPKGAIRPWVRGRWYTIIAFWRPLPGGRMEIGIYLDGKLVGHGVRQRILLNPNWFPLRIGAEKPSTFIDPSFPSVHWVDGEIKLTLWSPR